MKNLSEWINLVVKYKFSHTSASGMNNIPNHNTQYLSENNQIKKSLPYHDFGLLQSTENTWSISYTDIKIKAKLGNHIYKGLYFGTEVVVKKIGYITPYEQEALFTLKRKVPMLKYIHHPNVAQFIGVTKNKQDIFIVVEYVPNADIISTLQLENMPWSTKIQIAIEIASAIMYLHSKKIILRHIESDRILFTENQRVKIVDYSFANILETKGFDTILEPEPWMSPEILAGQSSYNEVSDIYAFGILLNQLFFGYDILQICSPEDTDANSTLRIDRIPNDCPELFLELIISCCAVRAESRPSIYDIITQLKRVILELNDLTPVSNDSTESSDEYMSSKSNDSPLSLDLRTPFMESTGSSPTVDADFPSPTAVTSLADVYNNVEQDGRNILFLIENFFTACKRNDLTSIEGDQAFTSTADALAIAILNIINNCKWISKNISSYTRRSQIRLEIDQVSAHSNGLLQAGKKLLTIQKIFVSDPTSVRVEMQEYAAKLQQALCTLVIMSSPHLEPRERFMSTLKFLTSMADQMYTLISTENTRVPPIKLLEIAKAIHENLLQLNADTCSVNQLRPSEQMSNLLLRKNVKFIREETVKFFKAVKIVADLHSTAPIIKKVDLLSKEKKPQHVLRHAYKSLKKTIKNSVLP